MNVKITPDFCSLKLKKSFSQDNQLWSSNGTVLLNKCRTTFLVEWYDGEEIITKDNKILAVKYWENNGTLLEEEEWLAVHDDLLSKTWVKGEKSSVGYFTLRSKQNGLFLTYNPAYNDPSYLDITGIFSIFLLKFNFLLNSSLILLL